MYIFWLKSDGEIKASLEAPVSFQNTQKMSKSIKVSQTDVLINHLNMTGITSIITDTKIRKGKEIRKKHV